MGALWGKSGPTRWTAWRTRCFAYLLEKEKNQFFVEFLFYLIDWRAISRTGKVMNVWTLQGNRKEGECKESVENLTLIVRISVVASSQLLCVWNHETFKTPKFVGLRLNSNASSALKCHSYTTSVWKSLVKTTFKSRYWLPIRIVTWIPIQTLRSPQCWPLRICCFFFQKMWKIPLQKALGMKLYTGHWSRFYQPLQAWLGKFNKIFIIFSKIGETT